MTDRHNHHARWHEAGHAVAGWALGHRVRLVVVRGGSGFTEHYERDGLSKADSDAHDATILIAGRLAPDIPMQMARYREPLATGVRQAPRLDAALGSLLPDDRGFVAYTFGDSRPSPSDADKVDAIAAQFAGDERRDFIESCTARADDLVWSNAAAIALVASELSRRPALDGVAFESVIAAHTGQKESRP